jgi:tetratricopeptide (TPR) repeat protein
VVKMRTVILAGVLLPFLSPQSKAAPDGKPADSWVEVRSQHFFVASNAGEAGARDVARDFEEIRALFHSTFPELRVDSAQPIVILATRDEATMRVITPDDFGGPEHVQPVGVFHSDGEKDYVILRLDGEGTTAFHTIYHEYTHALMHLNFSKLPLWLNEGVAEFFGNSKLGATEATTGTADRAHLWVLGKDEWLPLDTLFRVKEGSPYYNERNPASVFYAESWAVVHYLLLDPDARRGDLLRKFLLAWAADGDSLAAARAAFGDLGKFENALKAYVKKFDARVGVVLPGVAVRAGAIGAAGDAMTARPLTGAEVLALRGDSLLHQMKMSEARPLLEQAVELGPNSVGTHEALGFFSFRNSDFAIAEREANRAIELGSQDFEMFYVRGMLRLRDLSESSSSTLEAKTALEHAAALNPMYAPTFEALTQVYSRSAETQAKALDAAETAVKLDPESRVYRTNLAYVLLNNGRAGDARVVAEKLAATAASVDDARSASSILESIRDEEDWAKEGRREGVTTEFGPSDGGTAPAQNAGGAGASAGAATATASEAGGGAITTAGAALARRQLGPPEWMAVEGPIAGVNCGSKSEVTLTMNLPRGPMDFHAADFGKVRVSGVSAGSVPTIETCEEWKGRRVKIWFRMAEGKGFLGEIMRVYFY